MTQSDLYSLIAGFSQLPSEVDTHAYGIAVRDLLAANAPTNDQLRSLADDNSHPPSIRFSALYAYSVRIAREHRYRDYISMVAHYNHEFGAVPRFAAFRAQAAVFEAGGDTSRLRRAQPVIEAAVDALPNVAGVLHTSAETVAILEERTETPKRDDVATALQRLERAISLSQGSYARFYGTMGRLLCLQGRYEEARDAVRLAIESEPYSARDYATRVAGYQLETLRIDLAEQRARYSRVEEEALSEFRAFRGQTVGILGLLAAAIAFIVTATTGGQARAFEEAAGIVIIQTGALVVAFSCFAGVFKVAKPAVCAFFVIVGVVVVAAGVASAQL